MKPFHIIVAIILAMLLSYGSFRIGQSQAKTFTRIQTDTLWKRDTHFIDRPVEVYKEREKVVYFPINDSILVTVHDTVYIALEREKKLYRGDDYEAQVSGISPNLDWIRTFPKTAVITQTPLSPPKKLSFGITAGPGLLFDGKDLHGGFGIVAGVQYSF